MIHIDTARGIVVVEENGEQRALSMSDPEAFEVVSKAWLRVGWDTKHVYSFTWMGRPVIQLPEDLVRLQEVIWTLQPDVILETGVAHGGSLVFYASLCKAIERGRVIGVDVEIRPHNRAALEAHPLKPWITLIEGDSVDPRTVDEVRRLVQPGDSVLVVLDSSHTGEHVSAELEAYAPLVSAGSYIVAADGITQDLVGAPRSQPDWGTNNPQRAAIEFVARHPDYALEEPAFLFNEGSVRQRVTYWTSGFIKRLR